MGAAVSITRLDLTASELRKAASGEKNSAAARRILALALVLDGVDRKTAAETCGMDRQTLRDWVHRYNAEGIAGLADAPRGGRPPALTREQMAELRGVVLAGPDPARHGVVRWRCVDLCDQIAERFDVDATRAHGRQAAAPDGIVARAAASAQSQEATSTRRRRLKKLRLACSRGATAARGRQADRDMVSGRSPCRSAGNAELHLGRTRLTPGGGARRSARLCMAVRSDLPGTSRRCRCGNALGQ